MNDLLAPRDAFGEALVELGRKNKNVVVLDADLANTTKVSLFAKEFPERFFELGIAEQNMICVAAGLSTVGKIPFAVTLGMLASKRACDQVNTSVAWPRLNVKVVGCYVGLLTGKTGASHQSVDDISIMRGMPNMTIVYPADGVETKKAVEAIANYEGPVYLRVERDKIPIIFTDDYKFVLGKGVLLKNGFDLTIIATGFMVSKSLEASYKLAKENIDVRVINIHTIKPIDRELIIKSAKETKAIVTVENHSIIGGLGSAVAEVLSEECPVLLNRIGINDVFGESGSNEDILEKYGLTVENIVKKSKLLLKRKKSDD